MEEIVVVLIPSVTVGGEAWPRVSLLISDTKRRQDATHLFVSLVDGILGWDSPKQAEKLDEENRRVCSPTGGGVV